MNDSADNDSAVAREAATGAAAALPPYPYPGLRAFQTEEAQIFFGRDDHIDQLLEKLTAHRFVAVIGPSGCGKSSLVRAGLIPLLDSGFMDPAGSEWKIAQMRPGEQPFTRLAKALSKGGLGQARDSEEHNVAFIGSVLRRGPVGLVDAVAESHLDENTNLLVVVDQFEELFRYRKAGSVDDAEAFVNLLLGGATAQDRIYVVITMRTDFLSDCACFSGLPEAMNGSQFLTPRLNREQTRQAIVGPARLCNGDLDSDLVNRLINDLADDPDRLPLLQHVLMRMWTRAIHNAGESSNRSRDRLRLSLSYYEDVGGFRDALSIHADSVYDALNDKQKVIAEKMFRCLCERGADNRSIRRPARLSEVAMVAGTTETEVIEVAAKFCSKETSFITPPQDGRLSSGSILDITHESLMTHWRTLAKWVTEESNSALRYRKLLEQEVEWEMKQSSELHGISLDLALIWEKDERPSAPWAARYGGKFDLVTRFIRESEAVREAENKQAEAASRRATELIAQAKLDRQKAESEALAKRRLSRGISFISILLAAMIVIALFAFKEKSRLSQSADEINQRDDKINQRDAEIKYMGEYAKALSRAQSFDFSVANKLFEETIPSTFSSEERHSRQLFFQLAKMMSARSDVQFKLKSPVETFLASPDGKFLLTINDEHRASIFDPQKRQVVHEWDAGTNDANAAAFDPTGKWLLMGGDGKVLLSQLSPTFEALKEIAVSGAVSNLAVSQTGQIAVAFCTGAVSLVGIAGSKETTLIPPPSEPLTHSLAFHPRENKLYVASSNEFLEWDLDTMEKKSLTDDMKEKLGSNPEILRIGFSEPDPIRPLMFAVASGDGQILATPWKDFKDKAAKNAKFRTPEPGGFVFLQHGALLAFPSWNRSIFVVQSVSTTMMNFAPEPDGGMVGIASSGDNLWSCGSNGEVLHWQYGALQDKPSFTLSDLGSPEKVNATAAAIAPIGSKVAVGFSDGSVRLYDLPPASGSPSTVAWKSNSNKAIARLDFNSTGDRFAVATADGKIEIFEYKEEKLVHSHEIDLKGIGVRSVAFSPRDRSTLAYATAAGKFGICDVDGGPESSPKEYSADEEPVQQTGQRIHKQNPGESGTFSARFDRDGKRLITSGKTGVHIWDATTGDELKSEKLWRQSQHYAVFGPTGKQVASSGPDSFLHVTSDDDAQLNSDILDSAGCANRIEFGRDASQLFMVGGDGRLHVFDLRMKQEIFQVLLTNYMEALKTKIADFSVRCTAGDIWIAVPVNSRLATIHLPAQYPNYIPLRLD